MITDPPVTGTQEQDRPEYPSAAGPVPPGAPHGSSDGSRAGQPAIEPVTAALDRLREAASSHDTDSPVPR
jgi:hypothetical protein